MKAFISYVSKAVAVALAYFVGAVAGSAVVTAAGASLPALPPGTEMGSMPLLIAALALGLGLAPLAAGLGVSFRARWAILALLAFTCLGVNTAIEAAIFTTLGGTSGIVILNLFTAAAIGAAPAGPFRPVVEPAGWAARFDAFRRQFAPVQWAWRLGAALLAFPVAYLSFGMLAAPFVVPAYEAGQFGLVLPGVGLILAVQLVRSALFLAASLPVLVAWSGSRVRLVFTLGAAHFVLNGLSGMLAAVWLPPALRFVHSVEILGGSLVYAAALVALLVRPRRAAPSRLSTAA